MRPAAAPLFLSTLPSTEHPTTDDWLSPNLCLHQLCQQNQRFLPAEIAGFRRNDVRHRFQHDVQLRPQRDFLPRNRDLDLALQFGIVKPVGVANAFVRYQLKERAGKGMALAVPKLVNDILKVPPTFGSMWCTLPLKPFSRSHFGLASASRNAL